MAQAAGTPTACSRRKVRLTACPGPGRKSTNAKGSRWAFLSRHREWLLPGGKGCCLTAFTWYRRERHGALMVTGMVKNCVSRYTTTNKNVAQVWQPAWFRGSRFGNLGYIFAGPIPPRPHYRGEVPGLVAWVTFLQELTRSKTSRSQMGPIVMRKKRSQADDLASNSHS